MTHRRTHGVAREHHAASRRWRHFACIRVAGGNRFRTARQQAVHAAEELGDLLFCIVNYARMSGLDAENILSTTNKKFESLFKNMERVLDQDNRTLESSSLDEKLDAWKKGKAL